MGRSDSETSVSACSQASRSASRGRPKNGGSVQRNAGSAGARQRAELRRGTRGQTARLGTSFRQAPQNQTVYMNHAMWMQTGVQPQMPHPQWPQLWAQRPFPGGSVPAQPSSSPGEEGEKSDKDQKKVKGKKEKKEKKEKKKDKKSKKDKKAKKSAPMACGVDEANEQPAGMVSHLEPSDSEPPDRESSESQPSGKVVQEEKLTEEKLKMFEDKSLQEVEDAAPKAQAPAASQAASGDAPAEGDLPADRLRQALSLLRDRREELEQMSAELDKANADNDELTYQLDDVEAELETEREANKTLAARSVEEQSKLGQLQSEIEEARTTKTSLDSRVSELQSELDQARSEKATLASDLTTLKAQLASVQGEVGKARENASSLQSDLRAAQSQLAEQLKLNGQLRGDLEGTQAKLIVLEELQKKAKDENVGILQSKLKVARLDLDKSRKELSLAGNEIYSSRRRQATLTEELAKARKLAVPDDARKGLNQAWESLLSLLEQQLGPDELEVGFHQLGAALRAAGFWQPEADTEEAAAIAQPELDGQGGDKTASPSSQPEPPLARLHSDADLAKGKLRKSNASQKPDKGEKHLRREKKEKKGKAAKEKRHAEEDGDEAVLEPMPHRTCSAGPPSLKKRRAQATARDSERAAKLTFAGNGDLASYVAVATYKVLKEKLWFTNPLANVQCEKCERRVPQQQGRLQGNPGSSQFMQEKFHCSDCVDRVETC